MCARIDFCDRAISKPYGQEKSAGTWALVRLKVYSASVLFISSDRCPSYQKGNNRNTAMSPTLCTPLSVSLICTADYVNLPVWPLPGDWLLAAALADSSHLTWLDLRLDPDWCGLSAPGSDQLHLWLLPGAWLARHADHPVVCSTAVRSTATL